MNDKYIVADYFADAGSLLLGNKDFVVRIPNGYGDGKHKVLIANDVIDRVDINAQPHIIPIVLSDVEKYRFMTYIRGEFNVYDYDCYADDELENENNIICKLDGEYFIYYYEGNVLLEKKVRKEQ